MLSKFSFKSIKELELIQECIQLAVKKLKGWNYSSKFRNYKVRLQDQTIKTLISKYRFNNKIKN